MTKSSIVQITIPTKNLVGELLALSGSKSFAILISPTMYIVMISQPCQVHGTQPYPYLFRLNQIILCEGDISTTDQQGQSSSHHHLREQVKVSRPLTHCKKRLQTTLKNNDFLLNLHSTS